MLNKVILIGRLTKDPELKYTPSGAAVTTFTLAVDRRYAKQGEERGTDFITVVAWRNTAEFVSKYFTKGRAMAVCGSIQTRTWDDNEGKRRYVTEVVADEVSFVDSKRETSGEGGFVPQEPTNSAPQQPQSNPDFEVTPDDIELPF